MAPDAITYSVLINSCEKCKQPERAMELFEAMQLQGLFPDVATCNVLFSACGKSMQPDCALELWKAVCPRCKFFGLLEAP